jgi:predicted regulator of Ras-like GTPase activity (Roadblock/LC7/MglB family)
VAPFALPCLQQVTVSRSPLHVTLEEVLGAFPEVVALAVVDDEGGMCAAGVPVSAEAARRSIDGLFAAADNAAAELNGCGLEQVVVDTPDGAVAALRDGSRRAVAVTRARPSSLGLLLYDLRRVLGASAETSPKAIDGHA